MTRVSGSASRDTKLAAAFVELTDTLIDDFDVIDVLTHMAVWCVELLDVSAAGLMLVDQRLLQQRAIQESELLASQLQEALHSRVVTEQAKGVLAERWQVVPDSAFKALRGYARAHNMLLSRLAESVVAGDRTGEDLRAYLDRVGVDAARPERGRARR
ncbi:MAG: ANTAR domain-containing protein [Streptomycetaceae bacterium]|nr:ANTAR domain-containing protein [Streptomycetaceae bacterium]